MGKLNFCVYLISRFYPTREIRKNLMHMKNMCTIDGWEWLTYVSVCGVVGRYLLFYHKQILEYEWFDCLVLYVMSRRSSCFIPAPLRGATHSHLLLMSVRQLSDSNNMTSLGRGGDPTKIWLGEEQCICHPLPQKMVRILGLLHGVGWFKLMWFKLRFKSVEIFS